MFSRVLNYLGLSLALAYVLSFPLVLNAQVVAAIEKGPLVYSVPKWNVFFGYSFLSPSGTVSTPFPKNTFVVASYHTVAAGGDFSGSYFFTRHVGVQVEVGLHEWGVQHATYQGPYGTEGNNDGFTTVASGLVFRAPKGAFTPFIHMLGGEALVDGPTQNPFTWGPDVTAGAGLDYVLPWFHHRFAYRLFQADYEYMHVDFGAREWGGVASINAARLSTGFVFPASANAPLSVILVCSANPTSIYPGDPLTVTSDAGNLRPKANVIYTWSGLNVKGEGATVSAADTTLLSPGNYRVLCGVKEGKVGKEGLRLGESAEATADFVVKAFEPPTISCVANPAIIKPGEESMVTAIGVSPQNRPLSYSYSTASGKVSGTGTTATYSSVGAPTGAIGIRCNVTDDKGQKASASTSVTITSPPPPPIQHTRALCSISFTKDERRPTRVDNEAKACLDEIALDLQKQPDAKAVVVGSSDAREKARILQEQKAALTNRHIKIEDPGAQRAVNTKDYLVREKGIDASRISVATSAVDDRNVEDYLVPAGANFKGDVAGTAAVDETTVKPVARDPAPVYQR
ncbi:MAG: hypothetical protein ABSF70_04400 [Terracidiphilus sp.]|jgi:outer membrane protein OmpA-like peptidoglycan-associated protein